MSRITKTLVNRMTITNTARRTAKAYGKKKRVKQTGRMSKRNSKNNK